MLRLLDLFCGAGGAGTGYHRAGFEVVGVDINPQPHYPFEFHQADAMTFPLDGFDVVHASPPCQAWTAYKRRPGHVVESPDLIGAVRERLRGVLYVIENVGGAPLDAPVKLCGSMFGLDVRRHRWFESPTMFWGVPECRHHEQAPRFPSATNRSNLRRTVEVGAWRIALAVQQGAMGVDWMTREELSQAIPPAYTEWIGKRLLQAVPV